MKESINIQHAKPEGLDALVELMKQLGYDVTRATMATQLERYTRPESNVLVACDSSEVLGLISGHLIPALHQAGNIGRITSMVVSDKARSSGVGRALVETREDWFRENECLRFEVTSGDHRPVAHSFYESLGYTFDERRFLKQP